MNIDVNLQSLLKAPEAAPEKRPQVAQNNNVNVPKETKSDSFTGTLGFDEDKNIVVKILDSKGKVVRQFPPEEYLSMMKEFDNTVKNLFSKKV